jgi:hypothetical protein
MIYLLWGLLNIGLTLSFIIICFKATKLIKEKIGNLATFIFVVGFFGLIGSVARDHKEQLKTWTFTTDDSLTKTSTTFTQIDLEKTLVSRYELSVTYAKDKNALNTPISAHSSPIGFIYGINWQPVIVMIAKTKNNYKFSYSVVAMVHWELLGLTIYTQSKQYHGIISLP